MTREYIDIESIVGGTITKLDEGKYRDMIALIVDKDGVEYDVTIQDESSIFGGCDCAEVDRALDIYVTKIDRTNGRIPA